MLNICLTGFDSKEKTTLIKFIEELADIGFMMQSGITFTVSVLVCNSPTSDKYKIAQSLGIEIVTKEWVYKCYEKHMKVDFKSYKFKPFRNVKLALFGFTQIELEKLTDFIIKNDGVIETEINNVEIVIFKKGTQFEFELRNFNKTLVDSDWILLCLERQAFVPTQFFNYNQQKIECRDLQQDLQCSKVSESLGKIQFNDLCYLSNCVIFIAIKDENLKKVIAQLISVADGYFVNILLPVVTHIIYLQGCSEEVNQQFQYIVHPKWLYDSFLLKKKLNEEEYQVKIKLASEQQQSAINSFATSQEDQQRDQFLLGKLPETRPFMEDNNNNNNSSKFGLKSQSFSNNNSNLLAFNRFSTSTRKTKLFEQCQIFIFDHSSLDKSSIQLLSDNGALVERLSYPLKVKVCNLKINKTKSILIFLLPDHDSVKETIQIIQKDCKVTSIKFFSYRWIQYCLDKNLLELQVVNKKLYHLQPTNQITPTILLKDKLIYVQSNNVDQKVVFKNLAKIVSGLIPQFIISDLEYFVTDKKGKKYQQVININENARVMNQIQIKDFDWLLQQYVRQNNQI